MSKPQQWVCFNDTHRQCNDSSTLIVLFISESICLLVHVQLVSLLQWHDNVFNNKQIFELVSILKLSVSLLQWHLSSMQWSIYSHRSTYQWIWSNVHVQLVSLLQWHDQCNDLLTFIALLISESDHTFMCN